MEHYFIVTITEDEEQMNHFEVDWLKENSLSHMHWQN